MATQRAAVTFAECVANAKRLLEFAESETDLVKMERYEKLADSWTSLAHVIRRDSDLSSYSVPHGRLRESNR